MTRRTSEILDDLCKVAAHILAQPAIAFGSRAALDILREDVSDAIRRPAEVRVIDDRAAMLITCLQHMGQSDRLESEGWAKVARVLHERVTLDRGRALEAELREMTGQSA